MKGKAVAASGHTLVSKTAVEIMAAGGNAFDGAVAAGFMAAVAEPVLTSLGGGGFLLAAPANGAPPILFDFFSDTPGRGGRTAPEAAKHFFPVTVAFAGTEQDFNVGLGSVATPGVLKGLLHVHRRLGRLPLADILAPAAHAARHGVTVNEQQAYFFRLLEPILTMSAPGRRIFAPSGALLQAGARFRNPDLADFLDRLARDPRHDFYQGEIARRIATEMRQGGGLLTEEDLAAYRVVERQPLAFSYRDLRLLTNPPPSLGGVMIRAILQCIDQVDLTGCAFGAPGHLVPLARILRRAEEKRAIITAGRPLCARGTTHLSVRDEEGNLAAMTTSNGEGSGYFVPGCGVMLNNMLGEEDLHPAGFHAAPPGTRIGSMMAPTLVLDRPEGPIIIGSGGSMRIRSAIPQVLVNLIDFHLAPAEAVRLPRVHWDGQQLQMEPGFPPETVAQLQKEMAVRVWPVTDVYFGGVHVVAGDRGGGDPRRNGAVAP